MQSSPRSRATSSSGSLRMQLLVVVAILMVLAALGVPVYRVVRQNNYKADTLERLKQLSTAAQTYFAENNGLLPEEDAPGPDTWQAAADPANARVWYNVLPKKVGKRSVGELAATPSAFYDPANLLYVPGADYPEKKKLSEPFFAIAMNSRLQRRDAAGLETDVKVSDIPQPHRTVLFLEQGLPGETRSMPQQSKKDYDGASKGSAKSFVARYRGKGWLLFVDGHAEEFAATDLLTETGRLPFPPGPDDVLWAPTPEEDPNKT